MLKDALDNTERSIKLNKELWDTNEILRERIKKYEAVGKKDKQQV